MKKYTFKVEGMSCSHCERAVVQAVKAVSGVKDVSASASKKNAVVTGTNIDTAAVAAAIASAGYTVEGHEESDKDDEEEEGHSNLLRIAIAVAAVLSVILLIRYTVGFDFVPVIPEHAGFGLLFVAGLLTSVHCVAMCGGITISQCINSDAGYRRAVPAALYNAGRIISYTAFGAVAGSVGSLFSFSSSVKSGIMIFAGIFMALMGLQLIGVVSYLKIIPMPRFFSRMKLKSSMKYGPFVVGILNGLMPCGPLQTMQLFAFGTGSATTGALSMFFFSIGTVPLMFGLGTASTFLSRSFTRVAYKAGGIIVIVLGLIMISNGLNLSGVSLIAKTTDTNASQAVAQDNVQKVVSIVSAGSYQPVVVQKGIPVELNFKATADSLNGCNRVIVIPAYGIQKELVPGDNIVKFTPTQSGPVPFTCWMGMITSSISVVDDVTKANPAIPQGSSYSSSGCCCGGALR